MTFGCPVEAREHPDSGRDAFFGNSAGAIHDFSTDRVVCGYCTNGEVYLAVSIALARSVHRHGAGMGWSGASRGASVRCRDPSTSERESLT